MNLNILKKITFAILFLGLIICNSAFAKTPDEECADATTNIQGSVCKVCGDCAVITLRTSEHLYKKCNEYQCDLVQTPDECSDPECAKQ